MGIPHTIYLSLLTACYNFPECTQWIFFLMHYSSLLLCTHKRSYKSSTTSQRSFKTGLQTQSCATFVGWITVAKPILFCLDLKSIQEWNCILLCSPLRMSFHLFFFFFCLRYELYKALVAYDFRSLAWNVKYLLNIVWRTQKHGLQ